MNNVGSPEPGWYPDPERPGWNRWWDGTAWGDYWSEAVAVSSAPAAAAPSGQAGIAATPNDGAHQQPQVAQPGQSSSAQPGAMAPAGGMGVGVPGFDAPAAAGAPDTGVQMAPPASDLANTHLAPIPEAQPHQNPAGPPHAPGAAFPSPPGGGSSGIIPPAQNESGKKGGNTGLLIGLLAGVAVLILLVATAGIAMVGGGDEGNVGEASQTSTEREEEQTPATENGEAAPETTILAGPLTADEFLATCAERVPMSLPGTDIEVDPIPESELEALGDSLKADTLSAFEVSNDTAMYDTLDGLRQQISSTSGIETRSLTLLDADMFNAWVIPGGHVFFTTALAESMTTDELGFVMAHEITHYACGHLNETLQREALTQLGAERLNEELGLEIDTLTLEEVAGQLFVYGNFSFQRDAERESDRGAVALMFSADLPLEGAPAALGVMKSYEDATGEKPPHKWLSTHPTTDERILNVEELIKQYDGR